VRLVAVSTDPSTLPANGSWYLTTNLPVPGSTREEESTLAAASLEEVVRLYGLRMWVEQSYKHIKGELGFSDFQVRSDQAIRRHWRMVFCAFSFCWWAYCRPEHTDIRAIDAAPQTQPVVPEEAGGKRGGDRKGATPHPVMAGSPAAGTELVGPLGNAVALLESVVRSAPAAQAASVA
jgi:Transposase DDE domain